jgi:hypothetical protein
MEAYSRYTREREQKMVSADSGIPPAEGRSVAKSAEAMNWRPAVRLCYGIAAGQTPPEREALLESNEDDLTPARGIACAILLSVPIWTITGLALWLLV